MSRKFNANVIKDKVLNSCWTQTLTITSVFKNLFQFFNQKQPFTNSDHFSTFRVILINLKSWLSAKKVFACQHKGSLKLVKVGYGTLILISAPATAGQRNPCCTCRLQRSRPQFLLLNRLLQSSEKGQETRQSKGIRERAAFSLFCISSTWAVRQWCKPCLNPCQEPKGMEGYSSSSLSLQEYQDSKINLKWDSETGSAVFKCRQWTNGEEEIIQVPLWLHTKP